MKKVSLESIVTHKHGAGEEWGRRGDAGTGRGVTHTRGISGDRGSRLPQQLGVPAECASWSTDDRHHDKAV